jgi:hypothetical protein
MKRSQLKFLKTKKGKLVAVVTLVGLGVLTFWGYNTYQVRADKQRFEEARATIDSIYADIVTQLGEPDDYKRSNTCSRPYQEFTGYGAPQCDVGIIIVYGLENEEAANTNMKLVQESASKPPKFMSNSTLDPSIAESSVTNTIFNTASDSYNFKGLRCVINYVYDTPQETYLNIKDSTKKPFQVSIGCAGEAKSQLYKLV